MQSHAKALAQAGIILVDSLPLHNFTGRYDNNNGGDDPEHVSNGPERHPQREADPTSLLGAGRELPTHYVWVSLSGWQAQTGFDVPAITDLILPHDMVPQSEPPLARRPDEEIIIEAPILQQESLHLEQLDPEDFDREFMNDVAQEVTQVDHVFLDPDLDAEVTVTVEPTDTVLQTVLADVDGRLSEDRALEKLEAEKLIIPRMLMGFAGQRRLPPHSESVE